MNKKQKNKKAKTTNYFSGEIREELMCSFPFIIENSKSFIKAYKNDKTYEWEEKKAVRMTERSDLECKEYGALDDRESKDISNQLMAYCKDFIRSLSSVSLCSICCPFNKYYVEDANSSPKISLEKDENIIKKAMNYVSNDENREFWAKSNPNWIAELSELFNVIALNNNLDDDGVIRSEFNKAS